MNKNMNIIKKILTEMFREHTDKEKDEMYNRCFGNAKSPCGPYDKNGKRIPIDYKNLVIPKLISGVK